MAAFNAFRLSVGLSLLSMPVTFKLDAGRVAGTTELLGKELVALELVDTHRASRPVSGSMRTILTVSPFWANAAPAHTKAAEAATNFIANFM
jgi:hypothetical protein